MRASVSMWAVSVGIAVKNGLRETRREIRVGKRGGLEGGVGDWMAFMLDTVDRKLEERSSAVMYGNDIGQGVRTLKALALRFRVVKVVRLDMGVNEARDEKLFDIKDRA